MITWQTNYKCLIPNLSRDSDRTFARAMNLYLESLLLEVSSDDQTHLLEKMKEKWPHIFKQEAPEGAILGEETKVSPRNLKCSYL